MPEPSFREIQLNTKQVVFLFMACVVAAVAIFLLGVSVGKGVTAGTAATDQTAIAEPTADLAAGANPQASTPPKAEELKYHQELQGKPSAPPAPQADAPTDPAPTPKPAATNAATKPAAAAKPATISAKPPATSSTPAAPGEALYAQTDSFGSIANANRQVSQLKAKGIPNAFVFTAKGPGAIYKVRVGPFADRAALDAMLAKLRKEGYKPSAIR